MMCAMVLRNVHENDRNRISVLGENLGILVDTGKQKTISLLLQHS